MSKIYQENVVAIVVDEAHCILDWLVLFIFIINTSGAGCSKAD
jgi:hypothetical protein